MALFRKESFKLPLRREQRVSGSGFGGHHLVLLLLRALHLRLLHHAGLQGGDTRLDHLREGASMWLFFGRGEREDR